MREAISLVRLHLLAQITWEMAEGFTLEYECRPRSLILCPFCVSGYGCRLNSPPYIDDGGDPRFMCDVNATSIASDVLCYGLCSILR